MQFNYTEVSVTLISYIHQEIRGVLSLWILYYKKVFIILFCTLWWLISVLKWFRWLPSLSLLRCNMTNKLLLMLKDHEHIIYLRGLERGVGRKSAFPISSLCFQELASSPQNNLHGLGCSSSLTSRHEISTTSLGNLLQALTSLMLKNF